MIAAAAFIQWLGVVKGLLGASGVTVHVTAVIREHLGDLTKLCVKDTPAEDAFKWLEKQIVDADPRMENLPEVDADPGDDAVAVVLAIKTTPEVALRLLELHETGLYGFTVDDTAERVMCMWLQQRDTVSRD